MSVRDSAKTLSPVFHIEFPIYGELAWLVQLMKERDQTVDCSQAWPSESQIQVAPL